MRTLKESILSRSSHGAKGFEVQRREMIEDWLKQYNIKKYTINDDFTIDVDGSVVLNNQNLKEFPEYIQFGVVKRVFDCSKNNLTSLRGCPREVGVNFYCKSNQLTSLKGCPLEIGGDFICSWNKLTTLEGVPKRVGRYFSCSNNQLTSLEGAPKKVKGYFSCSYNKLTSLEGALEEVVGNFYCSNNKVQFTEEDVRRVCDVEGVIYK